MLSLEEREERRHQLGASEIHKLMNFDTQECQNLWELKVRLRDYEELDNDAILAGNILEEECLNYFEKTNKVELAFNERIEHKKIQGLIASLDARITDTSIPIENKVINEKTWERWQTKKKFNAIYDDLKLNIPKIYYYQIQTQITVLDVEYGILNINTLTDEEQEDPLCVTITELHNKQIKIDRCEKIIEEIESRAKYMLHCMKYKIRPSELDYIEKNLF